MNSFIVLGNRLCIFGPTILLNYCLFPIILRSSRWVTRLSRTIFSLNWRDMLFVLMIISPEERDHIFKRFLWILQFIIHSIFIVIFLIFQNERSREWRYLAGEVISHFRSSSWPHSHRSITTTSKRIGVRARDWTGRRCLPKEVRWGLVWLIEYSRVNLRLIKIVFIRTMQLSIILWCSHLEVLYPSQFPIDISFFIHNSVVWHSSSLDSVHYVRICLLLVLDCILMSNSIWFAKVLLWVGKWNGNYFIKCTVVRVE
jgi:hypothetical protein